MEAVSLPPLRVGIFADTPVQPRWIVEALAKAGASGYAEITLVAENPARTRDGPRLSSLRQTSDVTALVPAERRVRRSDAERCWRARIADARLDVAFALGDVDLAAIEGCARYGTWRFCFGESHDTCESLAGVHEALDGRPLIGSGIRITRPGRPDRVACQSWSRNYLWVRKSRAHVFAKSAEFVARALRDLHAGGERWIELGTEPAREPVRREITPAGLIKGLSSLSTRIVRRAAEKAFMVDQWSIALRFGGGDDWNGSLDGFFRLAPPKGWWWADPFPIERDGRYWIFFEELPAGASKAHISVVEVFRDGTSSPPMKVLERDYHLSYPFLVEADGALFMVPETADNRTVEVYRCVEFPAKWRLERVLLKGMFAADATLHREEGAPPGQPRWWMFANAAAPGADVNDELHVFCADSLLGDWKPHRRNPVKSDVRGSRPAGRLFRRGDGLYRPGQIGAPLYGAGIALQRVTRLTPDEYAEEEAMRILPADPKTLGIHTFNRAGELTVTDAFQRHPRF